MGFTSSLARPTAEMQFIVVPDGKRVVSFSLDEFPWITSLSIQLAMNNLPSITFGVNAPYLEAIKLLETNIFAPQNGVKVRVGYHDTIEDSPFFFGLLTQGGMGLSMTPDGLTGSITAVSASAAMFSKTQGQGGTQKITEVTLTPQQVIEDIVKRLDEITSVEFLSKSSTVLSAKQEKFQYGGNQGYFQILKSTIQKNNCGFWMENDVNSAGRYKLMVIDKASQHSSEHHSTSNERIFVMRGTPDTQNDIYPLLNFSPPDGVGIWHAATAVPQPGARQVLAVTVTDEAKVESSESTSEPSLDTSNDRNYSEADSDGNVIEQERPDAEVGALLCVASSSDQANTPQAIKQEAENLQGQIRLRAGFSAQFGSIGIPNMTVGEVIGIQGCSSRFNGLYVTEQLVHEWAPGSYTTGGRIKSQSPEGETPGSLGSPPSMSVTFADSSQAG